MTKRIWLLSAFLAPLFLYAATPAAPQKPAAPETEMPADVDNQLPVPSGDGPVIPADGYKNQFIKTVIAITIVFILVVVTIFCLRRYSGTRTFHMNSRKNIKVLERRSLSPNTHLYHIQVGSKQFVIAESKFDVRTLATLDSIESDLTD